MTDTLKPILPPYEGNPLLAALFAGAFMGSGLALVYLGTSDTGGITMIGLVIQKFFPYLHVGTLVTGINMVIVLAAGIIYRNIDSILYAIVTVYVSGLFMNKIVNNANTKNLIIVMSECTDKVRCVFLEEKKGITILKGEGGYTSETQRVIMGAASKTDCMRIQRKIQFIDPKALIIISDASNVTGKGFGHMI
ncbi:MAG: YitT family protein [Lachnospiraceae bacterium]